MQWHVFNEIQRRSPAPNFRLPDNRGGSFSLDDYRGWGNVVLFFAHDMDCSACRAALDGFATHRAQYAVEEAKIVALLRNTAAELSDLDYPFTVLADPTGAVTSKYADLIGADAGREAMVFVIDRFGSIYAASAADEVDDPRLHTESLEWLSYIGLQCPE